MLNEKQISFETARIEVSGWRVVSTDTKQLAKSIKHITTNEVMRTLPPNWNSLDSDEARTAWIKEREGESNCLALLEKESNNLIGILFLTKLGKRPENCDLRVGYLIAEQYWGLGYASEVISGLCKFAQEHKLAKTITGGVEPSNIGSVKVLSKNGFVKDPVESNQTTHFYKFNCNA